MKLAVVIPTLNEADQLAATVEAVRCGARLGAPQVVVADSGSADGTLRLARRLGVEVVEGPRPHRAAALAAGIARARGEVVLLLDADSRLPPGWDAAIAEALADPRVVGGAFELCFDGRGLRLRLVELVDRVRYRFGCLYYGDQGVFVRAAVLAEVGGVPQLPLMESAALCRRLKGIGRLRLVRHPILTSPRRFVEGGVLRVFALDIWLWWLFLWRRPVGHHGGAYWRYNHRRGEGGVPLSDTPRPKV